MEFRALFSSPFTLKFSFEKLLDKMELEASVNPDYALSHKRVLEKAKSLPELREGITNVDFFEKNEAFLKELLMDIFPPMLSSNEIKAIGFPFYNFFFNPTDRLKQIVKKSGRKKEFFIKDLDSHRFYIMSCSIILRNYYKINLNTTMPFIFDVPDENGIVKYYRFINNIDFIDVSPGENFKELKPDDINELLDNFEDFDLWKEKFPPKSWEMKGFAIINFFDATIESATSNLKSKLINIEDDEGLKPEFTSFFRSIFQVPDLELGYTAINSEENKFEKSPINKIIDSFILHGLPEDYHTELLSEKNFSTLIESRKYFSISDFDKVYKEFPQSQLAKQLYDLGIKSAIFAPIIKDKKILGIIELVSCKKVLNSINANLMEIVMPYLVETMDRLYTGLETKIQAIIQREYTSIHPSVLWKFHQEAERHIGFYKEDFDLPYRDIKFKNLTPLFGQSDIKNSSLSRNDAIKRDLQIHLDLVLNVLDEIDSKEPLDHFYKQTFEFQNQLKGRLKANSESTIMSFLNTEVRMLFSKIQFENDYYNYLVTNYYSQLDSKTKMVYNYRKKFDDSLSAINKTIADILDKRQEQQQQYFPFYYERFKTDGVEHNIYIGQSIDPKQKYESVYLNNLRLWQLRVICETEIKCCKKKRLLDYPLDITSLVLVYNTPTSIRFRMDEKRFDVDGSYNARYEVIKKRIDKSFVKGSNERVTQSGKLSIIYSQSQEKEDYLALINILQSDGVLHQGIEELDVEDLQGIDGLKALRVSINYDTKKVNYNFVDHLLNP